MTKPLDQNKPTVVVIDDDQSVCEALQELFESVGLAAKTFSSVNEFKDADWPDRPGCVVLDIRLPGQSGLDFQESLVKAGTPRSIVLISAHVDVPMSVRAMKSGAVDVLLKPVRPQDLLEAVDRAIEQDAVRRKEAEWRAALEIKFAILTDREREIMAFVVEGMQNKQIADAIGVTEATVKLHRGRVMRKMEAGSLVQLVRMADHLGRGRSQRFKT
jgi:FixJ family two-component response regulator